MAPDTVPYELKRLIYDYADLQTIKSLRQVSKAWASVGVEFILLSTFHVTSHSYDVQRLIDVGSSRVLSLQAVKVIKKIVFRNSGWNARYFKKIVCSRHEHRQHYETVDFVPTQVEADALEELDRVISRKDEDDEAVDNISFLISAFKNVPQVKSIEIDSQNPFQNTILRKVWDEYSLEAYRPQFYPQNKFLKVLYAARMAGLNVNHFSHGQLSSSCFEASGLENGFTLHEDVRDLKSLELVIDDHHDGFPTDQRALVQLRDLISAIPALQNLSVNFETLELVSLNFLPATPTGMLHSLTLSSISVDPVRLLALLDCHAATLSRLRLGYVKIPEGQGSWRNFLEDLRASFGNKLEKFQISGMMRSMDGDGEQWILWPRYDKDWNVLENERTPRTRELEDFVLRGGPWPMVASDAFPFP